MIATIYTARPNAKRIKFRFPYKAYGWRLQIKQLDGSFYHFDQKRYSIINSKEHLAKLLAIFGDNFEMVDINDVPKALPRKVLNEQSKEILAQIEKSLVLKGYSHNTCKIYINAMANYLSFFEAHDIKQITKQEIESYVYHLIVKYKISNSKRNIIINAIKYYYEKVLERPRELYDIQRPKKGKNLPNVLSAEEVKRLIEAPKNLKHRAILTTIYSSGLRMGELLNLRIEDIHSDDEFIFIKGGKGRVDRRTVLSKALLILLRKYYLEYRPAYWLFEGAEGGQYSASSVNKLFRRAVKTSNINPWATPHTLRHSFATHLMLQGVSTRMIQMCLGHASSKTTEIYTHVINVNNRTIKSPLDFILEEKG